MSQKFKRLKSQVEDKKQILIPTNQKSHKKTAKTPKQTPINHYHQQSSHLNTHQNLNHFNSNQLINSSNSKQPTPINSKQAYSNGKLNRIQSEYIKPINCQSLPKTPKVSKLNSNKIIVDSTKLKKYPGREQIQCKDYMQTQPRQKLSKKLEEFNKNVQFVQSPLQELVKKSMKTSKISSKSLSREQSSFRNEPTINPMMIKQKSKTKRNQPQYQKSDSKRLSKKGFDSIKITQRNNIKTPSMKKTPSTCSVKKYYIMQKSKPQKKTQKQGMAMTTYRGVTNPQDNHLSGYRKSSANILKIYNSSTDLNNTAHSSEREREILERVQRTLEYYRMNLDEEIEKRKNLQLENNLLKDQLSKAMRGNDKTIN